jgi:hypothetical protein
MKRIVIVVAVLFLSSALSAARDEGDGRKMQFTKHFNNTLFAIAEKGQVSIEVLLDETEYKIGKDAIGIVVHDSRDEDVEDAKLEVTVTGAAGPLSVKEKGGGLYTVPAGALPGQGQWELKVSVRKKKIDDFAVFFFPEATKAKLPAGKYDAERLKGM